MLAEILDNENYITSPVIEIRDSKSISKDNEKSLSNSIERSFICDTHLIIRPKQAQVALASSEQNPWQDREARTQGKMKPWCLIQTATHQLLRRSPEPDFHPRVPLYVTESQVLLLYLPPQFVVSGEPPLTVPMSKDGPGEAATKKMALVRFHFMMLVLKSLRVELLGCCCPKNNPLPMWSTTTDNNVK